MCDRCHAQTQVTGQPTRIWVDMGEHYIQGRLAEAERALMNLASTHEHTNPTAIGSALVLVQAAREEVKRARRAQEATRAEAHESPQDTSDYCQRCWAIIKRWDALDAPGITR